MGYLPSKPDLLVYPRLRKLIVKVANINPFRTSTLNMNLGIQCSDIERSRRAYLALPACVLATIQFHTS